MSTKHPWEHKQKIIVQKTTKEEFEAMIEKTKQKEDKFKSDLFVGDPNKPKVNYTVIDGVPHKMTPNGWKPLTKL